MSDKNILPGLGEFISYSSQLGETALKLAQAKVTRKTVNISSSFAVRIILFLIAVFAIFFLSAAAALWLGKMLHSVSAGLFIIGGFYTLMFVLLFLFKDKFLLPLIRNGIIKKIYE
ncbi:MAG: hypothetical protein ABUT20_14090 [Bacteroidota bacterium]